jgi:hypothetical protein
VTMETLAEALEQSHAAADAAEREHEKLCDFLRSEVEQRDRDAVRAAEEAERVRRFLGQLFHAAYAMTACWLYPSIRALHTASSTHQGPSIPYGAHAIPQREGVGRTLNHCQHRAHCAR